MKVADETADNISLAKDDGIARGTDSFTLLDHPPTRNNFTNDLLEASDIYEAL